MTTFKYEIAVELDEESIRYISCPISLDIMVKPVTTPYGHTFDFYSIKKWIEKNNSCPFSRKKLSIVQIQKNEEVEKKLAYYYNNGIIKKINIIIEKNLVDIPLYPDFSFLEPYTRRMIESAYRTVTRLKKWDYIHNFTPNYEEGFQFSNDIEINNIMVEIDNEYKEGHSGYTMGFTMRTINTIAKHGYQNLRNKY